jgi:hypothetical protein
MTGLLLSLLAIILPIEGGTEEIVITGDLTGVYLTLKKGEADTLKVLGIEPLIFKEGERLRVILRYDAENFLSFLGLMRKKVDLRLPTNFDLRLNLEGSASTVVVDAEGLRLSEMGITLSSGSIIVTSRSENPISMERLKVSQSLGSLQILGLGFFRAHEIEIGAGMSKLEISLEGSWKESSDISIFSTLSRITLWKPKSISLHLISSGVLNPGKKKLGSGPKKVKVRFRGSVNKFEIKEVPR